MFSFGSEREEYFNKYDAKTDELIEQNIVTIEVANFLYQSDCEGKIDRKKAKQLYELIKECDSLKNLKNKFTEAQKPKISKEQLQEIIDLKEIWLFK